VHISYRGNTRERERKSDNSNIRSRLYQLLAAAHFGSLGLALTGAIRFAASSMFEGQNLPEVSTSPRTELYGQVYGHPAGCPNPDGNLTAFPRSLLAKPRHLSWGAHKRQRGSECMKRPTSVRNCCLASTGCSCGRKRSRHQSGYSGLFPRRRAVVRVDVKHTCQLDLHRSVRVCLDRKVKDYEAHICH
jgi:hypothetical protein